MKTLFALLLVCLALSAPGQIFQHQSFTTNTDAAVWSMIDTRTATNKAFAVLTLSNSQLIAISVAGVYKPITNFNLFLGTNFLGNPALGSVSNLVAGWYRISLNASLQAPTSNDSIECDLFLNGAQDEHIASHTTSPGAANRAITVNCQGILFLAANSEIQIGITDASATGNMTVIHAQITVDQP